LRLAKSQASGFRFAILRASTKTLAKTPIAPRKSSKINIFRLSKKSRSGKLPINKLQVHPKIQTPLGRLTLPSPSMHYWQNASRLYRSYLEDNISIPTSVPHLCFVTLNLMYIYGTWKTHHNQEWKRNFLIPFPAP